MNIGIVTCRVMPEPDPDQELLLAAIEAAGHEVRLAPWDDPDCDPGAFDLCVLRSCWDYPMNPQRFRVWIEDAASRVTLLNPAPVVSWNLHKGYLREIFEAGVPIVPTRWLDAGQDCELSELAADCGWDDLVVKPAIGAGSYLTRRFTGSEIAADGAEFLRSCQSGQDMLVQKYMPSVVKTGERALVWIDGEFTHQVVKKPRYHGQDEQVSDAMTPTETDLLIAQQALACTKSGLLYARVDLIDGDQGEPLVSELELIEPSLFLLQHAPALDRLVTAIGRVRP
ncbi:MAG: hypothetical protein JSW21_11925 [Gammaproteobacteria bacterium]|nr:MAG: hypothetical protein JSW21_11925 [Gammaproteobacteria bacterium]